MQRPYPADWETYGRAAGPIRNQKMLDSEQINLCVAFPGGAGTADMVARCKKAHRFDVIEVPLALSIDDNGLILPRWKPVQPEPDLFKQDGFGWAE